MKNFLIVLFFVACAVPALAYNVELRIDGEMYYCSRDPNGGSSSPEYCKSRISYIKNKFNTCKVSNGSSFCFSQISNDLKIIKNDCPEAATLCYELCQNSNGSSYCYNQCYN